MNVPRVSIVTATYNRSNVLRFTIESLRAQTIQDWELIVVGDACTDDTEQVVRSFDDSRIRFFNLPVNSGEQATPNNEGMRRARGEYLAFLNHDDLWVPDHLAIALEGIERLRADLVMPLTIALDAENEPHLGGFCRNGAYEPHVFAPASSWLVRRSAAEAIGPWRPAREMFVFPSQEWLFRAWKSRVVMRGIDVPTVLCVGSGGRRNSYAERQWKDNAIWASRLSSEPDLLLRLSAVAAARQLAEAHQPAVYRQLRRTISCAVARVLLAIGVHPLSLSLALRHGRRGGFLDMLRKTRGLPPLPRRGGPA